MCVYAWKPYVSGRLYVLAWAADSRQLNTFELKTFCDFPKHKVLSSQYISFICLFGPKKVLHFNDFYPDWSVPWTCIVSPYLTCMTRWFLREVCMGITKEPKLSSISSPAWSISGLQNEWVLKLTFLFRHSYDFSKLIFGKFCHKSIFYNPLLISNRIKSWSHAPQFYYAMVASRTCEDLKV